MRQALIPSLVEVNHMHRAADALRKPDRRAVPNTEIPPSVDLVRGIIRHIANPTGRLRSLKLLAIDRARYVRIPAALEFLLVLVLGHGLLGGRQLNIVQHARLAGPINHAQPILIAAGLLVDLVKGVVTLGRADKDRPALTIRQRRADHLWENILRHLRDLVHHAAVKVNAAQAVRILGAEQ